MNWINVDDSLPEMGVNVLVCWWRESLQEHELVVGFREACIDWLYGQEEYYRWIEPIEGTYMDCEDVAYWMPLPELPEVV